MSILGAALRKEKPFREKTIIIGEDPVHGAPMIQRALIEFLARIQNEHYVLKICREREPTEVERHQLPTHMQRNSREELADQADPWASWRLSIEDWIEEFSFDKDPNALPRQRAMSEL